MSNKKMDLITFLGGVIAFLGALASIVTILGFFGIVHFPFSLRGDATPIPPLATPTRDQQLSIPSQASTPMRTLSTFCTALTHGDQATANAQLTPRYLNYVESLPPTYDLYTGCTFGPLTESSTSQGVIFYQASITFFHRSGQRGFGVVDLIKTSDGNWRIDNINCGANLC